jgi:tetratricopeptide (TPR) repeat protein
MKRRDVAPEVLILDATILQSRHAFEPALAELDRALVIRPTDPQAWLIRATVLRVLGRYDEALIACRHLAEVVDPAITALCVQSQRGLMGHLKEAYSAILGLSAQALPLQARTWRFSELGEMAERLGRDEEAQRWFHDGLESAPQDFYMRAAYADLLLRQQQPSEALALVTGHATMEPMLLRSAIAHKALRDDQERATQELLSMAFEVELQRGDAVHRREQARYLLDVQNQPLAALVAAQENWKVQREPDDLLILLRAAQAAQRPAAAAPVLAFLRDFRLEDVRLEPYRGRL